MNTVDPIRYAWKGCNVHVPFPAALARNSTASSVAASLSNAHADPTLVRGVGAMDALQAALRSFIVVGDTPRRLAEKMEELAERHAPPTT
jgi:hypothetical protein